jgi:hypothetical protein
MPGTGGGREILPVDALPSLHLLDRCPKLGRLGLVERLALGLIKRFEREPNSVVSIGKTTALHLVANQRFGLRA